MDTSFRPMADLVTKGRKKSLSHRHSDLKCFSIDKVATVPIPGVLLLNNTLGA